MNLKTFLAILCVFLAPCSLFAQESLNDSVQSQSTDFKGPQIRNFQWEPVQPKKDRSVRFQAEVIDDDQLDFARLSLSLKDSLRCDTQNVFVDSDEQPAVSLTGVQGRENIYEAELRESRLQKLTGAQGFNQACYRLEAQDRAGNLSFQLVPAPVLPALAGTTEPSRGSFRKWGIALAAAALVAVVVASASESDDGGGSGNSLLITAPVPVP